MAEVMEAEPLIKENDNENGSKRRRAGAEGGAEEPLKRHKHHRIRDKDKEKEKEKEKEPDKHRHHRHHKHKHHHHHKKHRSDVQTESLTTVDADRDVNGNRMKKEEEFRFARVSAMEEKEEGEIVEDDEEEGAQGQIAVEGEKPVESEMESGEIQPEESSLMAVDQDFNSAASKVFKENGQEEVKRELLGFTKSAVKKDDNFNRSIEDMDAEKIPVEKKREHANDRTGKEITYDGLIGEKKYFKIYMKSENLQGESREIAEDGGSRGSSRKQVLSNKTESADGDDFELVNYYSYSRHRKETLPGSPDVNLLYGCSVAEDSGKLRERGMRRHRSQSRDDHNDQRHSKSPSKVTEKERHRRRGHSQSPSKVIEQEMHYRQGHLGSPLKDTERHTRRDLSRSPPRDNEKEKRWQRIGIDSKESIKDPNHYTQQCSPGSKERLELKNDNFDKHANSQYKQRLHDKSHSKSQDVNKQKQLDKDRSRSPEVSEDKYRSKDRPGSRDKYRERDQSPSRDRHRERGTSPYRETHRDRVRSPSRDRHREKVRSPSRDRHREKVRSPSHSRHRERGISASRDMYRDTLYGVKRSRSRETRERHSHSRERTRVHEELRKRSRSHERDLRQSRSSRDHSARARRSNSRDISKAGRIDERYDRHHRYVYERQSERERERQRERILEKERISKHQKTTQDTKEEEKLREEENQEEYQERVALQLAEQEEDDVEKIKEESRKRRQAILEKYKQQKKQSQTDEQDDQNARKDGSGSNVDNLTEKNTVTSQITIIQPEQTTGHVDNVQDGNDVFVPDPMFSIGKEPLQNGTLNTERVLCSGGLGEGSPKSEVEADMFCDDIFGESPARICKPGRGDGLPVDTSGLHDNWDDAEGYYSYRIGEVLDSRYEIIAAHGKGVFSSVVRAKDLKSGKGEPEEVAIKIIRNNETMYKAGQEELVILKKLAGADPEDKRHCVRFLSSFKYRNHLCLVFESLHMNLREVLKKFGRNIGLKLTAVRAYAKQLFIALKHLKNCGVLHCDIKPDNMLVNEAKNVLKLCDFGNAMFAGKNEITPYLVSRFYRAPEIILGLPYDHAMDIWSIGCCLFELYLGKVLFPGPTNNDMLRLHMELKGSFPKKMLRKGSFTDQHFDQDLNFHATEEDPVSKKTVKRLLVNIKPKDIGNLIQSSPGEDPKMLSNFKDLLERIFILDPDKRLTVSQALSHPFITGK